MPQNEKYESVLRHHIKACQFHDSLITGLNHFNLKIMTINTLKFIQFTKIYNSAITNSTKFIIKNLIHDSLVKLRYFEKPKGKSTTFGNRERL